MAATTGSSSSSAAAADDPALALPSVLNVKLDPTNYPIWLAQIVPLLRSRRLISFVDGTSICPSAFLLGPDGKPSNAINPAYEDWIQMDQLVLSWINGSLSHPVLATVASSISARATWLALAALFSTPVPVSDNGTAAMVGSGGCGSGGGEMSSSSTTGEGDSKQMDLPGYKFSPTEEELVGFYLKKTIEGKDAKFRDRIPVIDVCNHKPSDLPEYFFSKPNYMNTNSNRRSRTTDEGFYKSTGKVREIKAEQSQAVIGNKRILSYYEGRVPKAKKTKHVMHEYSVTKTKLAQLGAQNNQQRELVLCHLTNKSAKSEKLKDDSICGDELAEPAIGNEISYNSEDDQAAATDMIQGPDEHLADKDVLLGTENRNECAESESPNGFSPTDNNDISTCVCFGSPGSFDVPGGFFLSDFDDLFNEPSCADVGVNMDSTFLPPQQLAATSATTPTSATSFGGFGVGSSDGFFLSDFNDLYTEAYFQPEENLGSVFHPFRPQDYTLLSTRNTELGDVMHANNYIDMQW
ncbi:NAC domain-containing protein 91-like [Prunus dulcis]|uniref:NAC domain-containing protein 91-like n=1 Tax=Prunus dulcis TaxID=3755 RepID=UPI001483B76D|nr:NAC domain-containing protein 91-like [Prunus dulcis]